jgi:hypothetical protein
VGGARDEVSGVSSPSVQLDGAVHNPAALPSAHPHAHHPPFLRPPPPPPQELDSLESLLREVEVASMAKVWAYPDDLAPILAGIRGQEAHQNSRLVGARGRRRGWGCCPRVAGLCRRVGSDVARLAPHR